MTIEAWLKVATEKLAAVTIASARLDAELLLANVLKKPREYILAHPETQLRRGRTSAQLNNVLQRRLKREPLAYIVGKKEFYGRMFAVNKNVLVPRPESEAIIDVLKKIDDKEKLTWKRKIVVADIGTGSGCLAITAKLELPDAEVIATDIDAGCLKEARINASKHDAAVKFQEGSLLAPISQHLNYELASYAQSPSVVILANLPYVSRAWTTSPETTYEPDSALYAAENGLELINQLITQASRALKPNDFLLLEADPRQQQAITRLARQYGFELYTQEDFILGLRLVT